MLTVRILKSGKRASIAAAAVLGAVTLAGCGNTDVAAEIGDVEISTADVDLLADAMCDERESLAEEGQQARASRADITANALLSLINAERAAIFAEANDIPVDHAALNEALNAVEPHLGGVDEEDMPRLRELVGKLFAEQQQMATLGEQQLGEAAAAASQEDPQALVNAGRQIVATSGEVPEVEISPEFDTAALGGEQSTQLSVRAGTEAAQQAPDEEELAALPANLRCG